MKRWLSKYLSILTLVPVIFLFLFICTDIFRAYHALDQANKTISSAKLANVTSQLVYELQKERGMSAGYISSKGQSFAAQLRQQHSATNLEVANLTRFMNEFHFDVKSEQTLHQLASNLSKIKNTRKDVEALSIDLSDALAFYTQNNQLILDLNGYLANELEESNSSKKFLTLYNLAFAKEQAGIERAVLSSVFASDTFTSTLFTAFIERVTKQDTYLNSAFAIASPEFQKVLDGFSGSAENNEVKKFRSIATRTQSQFNVDPNDWFNAATLRINKLKNAEQNLLDEMVIYGDQKVLSAISFIMFDIVICIAVVLLAVGIYSTVQLRATQSHGINRFMRKVDSDKDLTGEIKIVTEDELGKIASLINDTFGNIRADFNSFKENAYQIGQATSSAVNATNESKDSLMQLQLDISSIATATEEMSASINSVMENMLVASDEAKSAAQETVNGENAVKTSMLGIAQTAEEVALVGNTITDLNSRVHDILGMVDVIKSVAEQTNLLALNAAIEAARAGEQGRGFAVVADEVRSLAQRTQQSTTEISNVVDELKNSSQKAFLSIESGNQQAKEAVSNAQQISAVLSKIVNNIKSVDDVTRVIASSTQEQGTVIQSINVNVGNIDTQARKNVDGAQQLSVSSLQLSQIAKHMEARIAVYKF